MDIWIKLLSISDKEGLLKFELTNRKFFEDTCLPRGDSYYEVQNFNSIIEELVQDQEKGLVYMYLIYNNFNEIIGRVNLVDVQRGNFNKAELGYRIGEIHQGKGYATKAVNLILKEATNKYKLHRIEAGTSINNIASQIVLIKNGFQFVGKQEKYILLNGKWHDNAIFEKVLD